MSKENNNSRWWDFYLVRYMIGTIVGTIILYLLLYKFQESNLLGLGITKILKELIQLKSSVGLIILITGGLAICYISSSPILILHATRLWFLPKDKKDNDLNKNSGNSIPLFTGISFFILGILLASVIYYFYHISPVTGTISLIILIPFSLFLFFWLSEQNRDIKGKMKYRYFSLVEARENKLIKEYPESYKHLREHGNAFFIVLFEILLGLALFQVNKPYEVIAVLAVWIIPPTLIWFFGNYLEGYLLELKTESTKKED